MKQTTIGKLKDNQEFKLAKYSKVKWVLQSKSKGTAVITAKVSGKTRKAIRLNVGCFIES